MSGGSGGGGKSGRGGGSGQSTDVGELAKGITDAKIIGTLPSDTKEVGVRIRGYLSAKETDLIKREGFRFDRDKKEWYDPSPWSPKGITEGIKGSRLRMLGKSATIEFRKVA
jgi:hypothetical protein